MGPRVWAIIAGTYCAYVTMYCARKPFSVTKSVIMGEDLVPESALGIIDTALLTAYALGQLSLARITRILGRKGAIVASFSLAGCATASFGLASGQMSMCIAWATAGLFAAPAGPLFSILVSEATPIRVRGSILGIWSSCENVGGAFANLVAARVLLSSGWRTAFFASGSLVLAWAPLLWLVVPSDPEDRPGQPSSETSGGGGVAPLSVPGVRAIAASYTLVKSSRYCLMFWLPYFLSTYVQLSPADAGVIAALLDVAGALGAVLTGVACDRFYGGST